MRRTKNKRIDTLARMLRSLETREQNDWIREKAAALRWTMAEHARLTLWIKECGERTNTCTQNVLGEVCADCRCGAKTAA